MLQRGRIRDVRWLIAGRNLVPLRPVRMSTALCDAIQQPKRVIRAMQIETARQQMIYHQVRPWDVSDSRVLDALARVRRENFVPDDFRALAFADAEIPLPCGQSMLKPVIEGRLLQGLDAREDHRALVVGTGSGFTSACVAQLAEQVVSIDIHRELIAHAAQRLADEHIHNVELQEADFVSFKPTGLFDRILITGSMPFFDERLPEWLKPGGKLVMIAGEAPAMDALLVTRTEDTYTRTKLFETVVQRLEHVPGPAGFTF